MLHMEVFQLTHVNTYYGMKLRVELHSFIFLQEAQVSRVLFLSENYRQVTYDHILAS